MTNSGGLCDVVRAEIYVDSELSADARSEVEAGDTVEFVFESVPEDAVIRVGGRLI